MTFDQSCSRAGIRKLGSLRRNPAFRLSVQFSRRTALGRSLPGISAIWPVRAKIPAPIMTPVPKATAPISDRLSAWYFDALSGGVLMCLPLTLAKAQVIGFPVQ